MKSRNPMPTTPEAWIVEIAAAYRDAAEAIPFGPMVGERFREAKLFHLAPAVAVKFRGLGQSTRALQKATDAALASYVANRRRHGGVLRQHHLAFAFCYLASHYGLNLLTARQVDNLLIYIEENRPVLSRFVRATKPNEKRITKKRKKDSCRNEKRIRVARSRDTILGWTKSGHERCEWGSYGVSASDTDAVSRRDGRSPEVCGCGGRGGER